MRFGFFVWFCFQQCQISFGKGPALDHPQAGGEAALGAGCRKLYQLQITPLLGLSIGTGLPAQPAWLLAQPGRSQATTTPASSSSACTPAFAQQQKELGQKLTQ